MMDFYQPVKVIGKGAFGTAISVVDKLTREKKIIKMSAESPTACAELYFLRHFKHRYIVQLYDFFKENGQMCVVMEYCDGGDLEQKIQLQTRPFTEQEILSVFIRICLPLDYLHDKNIVHCDLKPSNIFLTSNGEPKLGDFGVTQILNPPDYMGTVYTGTRGYMSPEMVKKPPYNNKSDVWSLGCVLYNMVTGNVPLLTVNMAYPHIPLPGTYSLELRLLVHELLNMLPAARPSVAQILEKLKLYRVTI